MSGVERRLSSIVLRSRRVEELLVALTSTNGKGHSPWLRRLLEIMGFFSRYLRRQLLVAYECYREALQKWCLRSYPCFSERLPTSSPLKPYPPGVPTDFPQFSRLPAEIRLQIWTEALPGRRLLMLQLRCCQGGKLSSRIKKCFRGHDRAMSSSLSGFTPWARQQDHVFSCATPPPALLAVSVEAREVALRHYRLGLAPGGYPHARIYVNLDRDVIGIPNVVMESIEGCNLFFTTPDLLAAKYVCLASDAADDFLRRHDVKRRLLGADELVVADSALFGNGEVPAVAGLDWEYWIRWQWELGLARWIGGRARKQEIDFDGLPEFVHFLWFFNFNRLLPWQTAGG